MASVFARGPKSAPRWYARFKAANGVWVSRRVRQETRRDAMRIALALEAKAERQRFGLEAPECAGVLVGELLKRWANGLTNRSAYDDRCRVHKWLIPQFGTLRLVDLTLPVLMAWLDDERGRSPRRLGPGTLRHLLNIVSRLFGWAIERGLATVNPVRQIPAGKRPQPSPKKDHKKWIEDDAIVQQLMATLPEPFNLMFYVGNRTGMRLGEIAGLRLSDVADLAAGAFYVRYSYLGPLKEDRGRGDRKEKWAPAPADAAQVLGPWIAKRRAATSDPEALLFPGADGFVMRKEQVGYRWERAADALKLNLTWYQATRHSFASRNLSRGASLDEVAAALGHSTPAVTARHYALYVRKNFSPVMTAGLGGGPDGGGKLWRWCRRQCPRCATQRRRAGASGRRTVVPRKPKKQAHGQGSVYQRGGGGWRIRWREGGRRRYASGFPSRELAQQVLNKVLADVAAGRAGLPPDPKSIPPLKELAESWLKRRVLTHRSHRDDRSRWDNHLKGFFGHHRPADVTAAEIRRFAELKLSQGLSSTTVGHIIRLLSVFFSDLVEEGTATANPVRALPRSTRRLMRNAHDPKTTPFLERLDDVRRVYLELPERYGVMFAIGALGGLRPGEVLGLSWEDVDLSTGRILVHQQVHRGELGPLKDDAARPVPILPPLAPVLAQWKLVTGGAGLLFPPLAAKRGGRPGSPPRFVREHTLGTRLRAVLKKLKLTRPGLNWYRCTRHTFASQWVIGGGSIEKLAAVLGHADITTTQRYAHLRVDLFREADLRAVAVDLSRPAGRVVELAPRSGVSPVGCGLGAEGEGADEDLSASN